LESEGIALPAGPWALKKLGAGLDKKGIDKKIRSGKKWI